MASAVRLRSSSVLAHVQLGEHDEAHRLAAEELQIARRWGAPGVTACGRRDPGRGHRLLRESVKVAAGSKARCEHAR